MEISMKGRKEERIVVEKIVLLILWLELGFLDPKGFG